AMLGGSPPPWRGEGRGSQPPVPPAALGPARQYVDCGRPDRPRPAGGAARPPAGASLSRAPALGAPRPPRPPGPPPPPPPEPPPRRGRAAATHKEATRGADAEAPSLHARPPRRVPALRRAAGPGLPGRRALPRRVPGRRRVGRRRPAHRPAADGGAPGPAP